MTEEPYFVHGLRTIEGAIVVARVNEGDPNPGLFHGLLSIFMLDDRVAPDPIRVRIPLHPKEQHDSLREKVNSLVGKKATVVINRSPWSACGKSGIVNYLQSIEEVS